MHESDGLCEMRFFIRTRFCNLRSCMIFLFPSTAFLMQSGQGECQSFLMLASPWSSDLFFFEQVGAQPLGAFQ